MQAIHESAAMVLTSAQQHRKLLKTCPICGSLEANADSLRFTTYANFEILGVDNNSSDQSSDLVKRKYQYVKLINLKKNLGFAMANYLGAEAAKVDFYIFLNNDTIVTKTWLSELVNAIVESQDNKVAIAQSFLVKMAK